MMFLDMLLSYCAQGSLLKVMPLQPSSFPMELPGFKEAVARAVEKAERYHFDKYEEARLDATERDAEWRRDRASGRHPTLER